jgi:nucleoside-triphosphatase THEP1
MSAAHARVPPITALIYSEPDAAEAVMRRITQALRAQGWRLAGLLQHDCPRPGRSRCDMILEDLASGALVPISQDRGPLARGCRLDVGQLLIATALVREQLAGRPDLVVLNKFGKTEGEGAGLRELIAEVVSLGTPLLIAVPWRNIDNWRAFVGDLASEIVLQESGVDVGRRGDAVVSQFVASARCVEAQCDVRA